MKGHLRLLNIACAAKAKWRQITLQKPSRDSPLFFSLLGGSDKGFGIFVETVEMGSKAAEAGLKRGDQVRRIKLIYNVSLFFYLKKKSDSTNCSVPNKKNVLFTKNKQPTSILLWVEQFSFSLHVLNGFLLNSFQNS